MSYRCYGHQCEALGRNRGDRCRHPARVTVDGHRVCLGHSAHGFVPISPDVAVSDAQRERARRVLEN